MIELFAKKNQNLGTAFCVVARTTPTAGHKPVISTCCTQDSHFSTSTNVEMLLMSRQFPFLSTTNNIPKSPMPQLGLQWLDDGLQSGGRHLVGMEVRGMEGSDVERSLV